METHLNPPTDLEKLEFSLNGNISSNKLDWNFFPTPCEKYILVINSSNYKYWRELIELSAPFLANNGIRLIQIKTDKKSENLPFCGNIDLSSLRNILYLCNKSVCVLTDLLWVKKLRGENILLENKLPEVIANEVLGLCKIDQKISIKTLLRGPDYGENSIEIIPNMAFSPDNNIPRNAKICIRCDLFPNWQFALSCINSGINATIMVGKHPIPYSMLPFFKNCNKICFMINKGVTTEQVRQVEKLGINYSLLTKESEKNSQEKLVFFDFKTLEVEENWAKNNLDKLKSLPQDTRVKTTRLIVSKEGTFASYFHFKKGLQINTKYGTHLLDGLDDQDFLEEANLFLYYESRNTRHEEEGESTPQN
jgi:hypothetical protein